MMEWLFWMTIVFAFLLLNRASMRASENSRREKITRQVNKRLLQNRKLDTLYGRDSGTVGDQIKRAIRDVEKS